MITGVSPTGQHINDMLIDPIPNDNQNIFKSMPSNRIPIALMPLGRLDIISYRGGPIIRRLPNGDVNVRHVSSNGFNMIISPAGPKYLQRL